VSKTNRIANETEGEATFRAQAPLRQQIRSGSGFRRAVL